MKFCCNLGIRFFCVRTFWAFTLVFSLFPALLNGQAIRGTPGDLWADIILGQVDFGDINPNQTTAGRTFNAYSVVADIYSNPNRIYVYDGGNNRVLGFSDESAFSPNPIPPPLSAHGDVGYEADIVLGQPDFSHNSCNGDSNWQNYPNPPVPNASQLCGLIYSEQSPAEGGGVGNMAVDSHGDLYVPDYYNNRVLRYEAPVTSTEPASHVWGQTTFSGYLFNQGGSPTNQTLGFASGGPCTKIAGVAIDPLGNLWVADSVNNRVLRFPNPTPGNLNGIPSTTADVVLGQSSFNANVENADSTGLSLKNLSVPGAVRVDVNGVVYVLDSNQFNCSGRVVIYKPTSFNAGTGQYVYGTNDMVDTGDFQFGAQFFRRPVGLEFDQPVSQSGVTADLWVADQQQVLLYHVNPVAATSVAYKALLVDQPGNITSAGIVGDSDPLNNGYLFVDQMGGQRYNWEMGGDLRGTVGVDSSGDVFVSDNNTQDTWRFPAPIPTIQAGHAHSADVQIFKPRQFGMLNNIGTNSMHSVHGVAVGSAGGVTQLFVSDAWRLAYWNIPPAGVSAFTNGQTANGFTGTSYPYNMAIAGLGHIVVDKAEQYGGAHSHLWAIAGGNPGGQIQVYNLPLTGGDPVIATISAPLSVLGSAQKLDWRINPPSDDNGYVGGVAVDPAGNYLWVSDGWHNRVIRVRDPLGIQGVGPVVDIVLGQPDLATTGCNQGGATIYYCGPCSLNPTASSLYFPGALRLDQNGNLFVADHTTECWGNDRMLRWDASQIPAVPAACLFNIPATAVYGTAGSFTAQQACASNLECSPWEPGISQDESRLVVGTDPQAGGALFPGILQNPLQGDNPVGHLNDYGPQSFSSVFDDQGNLFVGELDRSRVLIYLQPFGSLAIATPSPTATNSPSPTLTWTVSATPSFVFTDTPTPTPTVTLTSAPTSSSTWTPCNTDTMTPSSTSTPTPTFSPSFTPTPLPELWPNPSFSGTVQIYLGLNSVSDISVKIYTVAFRMVQEEKKSVSPGDYLQIDLRDKWGEKLANGVYYVVINSPRGRLVKKVIVLR